MSVEKQIRLRLPTDLADRLLGLDSSSRSALVERAMTATVSVSPTAPLVSRCEVEALDVAIGMFCEGAAGGGVVGFRSEQVYLNQYSDFAKDLTGLRAKLRGCS